MRGRWAPPAEGPRGGPHTGGGGRAAVGPWVGGGGGGRGQGCIRRGGASEAAAEAVRQAVAGGCQSGWGRLLSVTNATEAGTWRQGDSGWAYAVRPGGGYLPPFQCIPVGHTCSG